MDNLLAILIALGGAAGLAGLITAAVTARNSAKQSDLVGLRTTITALGEENTRLRACLEKLEAAQAADRAEIAALNARITALNGQIASLKRENARLKRQIEKGAKDAR